MMDNAIALALTAIRHVLMNIAYYRSLNSTNNNKYVYSTHVLKAKATAAYAADTGRYQGSSLTAYLAVALTFTGRKALLHKQHVKGQSIEG